MAWVKVESSVSRNRKFVKAGPAPAWLWLCGLAYCQEGLTDGFIPTEALDYLGVKNAKNLAARLVDARLWDVVPGGWRIHDYLEHNKTAAEVRRTVSARATGGSLGGRPRKNLEGSEQETSEVSVKVNLPQNLTENPALTALTATAPTAEASSKRTPRAPLHDSSHRAHAHCGKVCVPAFLHSEFVGRWPSVPDPDMAVRDWYLAVEREWEGRTEARPKPVEFWQARFDEKWPTASAKDLAKIPAWARSVQS